MDYSLADFDYHLPLELIAQKPVRPRDHSRLLLLDKRIGSIRHRHFSDIVDYLKPGDLLVLNNSKVFPARLIGTKAETRGVVEIFLHQKIKTNLWECLLGGRVKEGLTVELSRQLKAVVQKNNGDGTWQVKFNLSGPGFWRAIEKIGLVPLPPYIKRGRKNASDKNNYQTVFADDHKIGSVAAPTAGLHFTKQLLKKLRSRGVKIEYVTLHVGLGTFAPVKTENILEHKMHSEFVEIKARAIREVLKTRRAGGRVIAVGTTSCRTLESLDWSDIVKSGSARLRARSFWTDIFIYPGYRFQVVDALVTNFHLPKSTLLMLVGAMAGKQNIDQAYQAAVSQKYRFFSYGDAMFIY